MRESWYSRSVADAATALAVDPATGLSAEEAAAQLARDGPNSLVEARRRGPIALFLRQFADVMIFVLLGTAVVSGLIGEVEDVAVVVAVVVLNAVVSFAQGWRAEKAMASLRRLGAAKATVARGGVVTDVPAADLVVGDVVLLEAGDIVPADLRLAELAGLRVNEAALTGESVPVDKRIAVLAAADLPLGDRRNLAFKGTVVTCGRARGLAVATGMATETGRIADMLVGTGETTTPLQRRLATLGQRLAMLAAAICVVIFAVGLLRGEPPLLMFMTALSVAVAAIPVVVTVLLALGAHRMVRSNALAVRSERQSLFRQGLLSNRPLLGAVVLTVGLQLAAIYAPVMNLLLDTQPLTLSELGLCLALSTVVFWAVELEKWLRAPKARTKIVP